MHPSPSFTRLDATISATQPLHWPHFAGSTLRGAFGRALRRAACVTGQEKCQGCPLRAQCAYGVVFDPAPPTQPLHPSFQDGLPRYVLQAPPLGAGQLLAGQTQSFSLLMLPGSDSHLPLIQHVLRVAIEQEFMHPGLFKLAHLSTNQVSPTQPDALSHPAPPQSPVRITLRWHTPLRLQHQGKPVFRPSSLDTTLLVRALLRRQLQWSQLASSTATAIRTEDIPASPGSGITDAAQDAASRCSLTTADLRWHDLERNSGTQGRKLPLGGLLGSATLRGPTHALQSLLPLLQLGELLHVGKETVMGLGHYQLSAIEPV